MKDESKAAREPARDFTLFPGFRLWAFQPGDFLPDLDGRLGFSLGRTLAATGLLAMSLGIMRMIPTVAAGALVIPLWFAAVGALASPLFLSFHLYCVHLSTFLLSYSLIRLGHLIFWPYFCLFFLISFFYLLYQSFLHLFIST